MKRFNRMLYVTEPSVDQDAAIARAVAIAGDHQASLTVLAVVPDTKISRQALSAFFPDGLTNRIMAQEQQRLTDWVAPFRDRLAIHTEVRCGRTFLEVIRTVLHGGYDLVLKPAEDPAWMDRLFGGDDMHLLRKCPCPVWMLKPGDDDKCHRVATAVDFAPNDLDAGEFELSLELLEIASAVAISDVSRLHLIHAWEAPEAGFISSWADAPDKAEMQLLEGERERHRTATEILKQRLAERIGNEAYQYLDPKVHLVMGQPQHAIPMAVREIQADLLVMGTVGRSGVAGLIMGNTAEMILNQVTCSVLAIKPSGFVSPVPSDTP